MNEDNRIPVVDFRDKIAVLSVAKDGSTDLSETAKKREKTTQNELKSILAKQGIVEFTEKELNAMPKRISKLIIIEKRRCRLRTRACGKSGYTYQIRFRRDGYDINACGKTIELAKQNFIEKAQTAKPAKKEKANGNIPSTFSSFALYHFENFQKEKISARHYQNTVGIFNRYLAPILKEKPIIKITPSDCKAILDEVKEQRKGKTADDLHSILNGIFKNAIAHAIISRNPLSLVLHKQHERENGTALTSEEENKLLNGLNTPSMRVAVALALFCGLRPNELYTAKIDGDFIIAENSKRKNGKVEYKKIPIINRLRPLLPNDGAFDIPNLDMLRRAVRKALPNHKLYDLRTTFYTRCDEYGVAVPARDEFVGHSSGVLTNTYRDLSDEYLLEEGKKLNKW